MNHTTFIQYTVDYENRWQAVTRDPDYSPEGKRRQYQRLLDEKGSMRGGVVASLAATWKAIRAEYSANKKRRAAAEEAEAARWDFQRLNYEAQAARSAVTASTDLDKFEVQYNQAAQSGNLHRARAWAEVGAAALAEKWPNSMEAERLARKMETDLQALTTTPELEAIDKAGAALTERAMDAEQYAKSAADFYGNSGGDVTEFYQNGGAVVTFHHAYNPTTGDLGYYALTVEEEAKP